MRRGQVMKSRYFLRRDDRGASLIAVIVALVFVMTIGIITMEITTANNRMSAVESSGTMNFYNAETVMDKLKRVMSEMAAGMVQEAYMAAAGDYSDASAVDSEEFQEKFMQKYMGLLEACFKHGDLSQPQPTTPDPAPHGDYHVGNYTRDEVEAALKRVLDESVPEDGAILKEIKDCLKLDNSSDHYFTTDYRESKEGLFTLRNITVKYKDEVDGYETSISTDLVFKTPIVQYEGGVLGLFMDYVLIAGETIEVHGSNVEVNGSVYAGTDKVKGTDGIVGIAGTDADATFTGDNIVTSGDIVVNNGSTLTFGGNRSATHIWAQNVRTEGKGDPSKLVMDGEINIADDLAINGNGSSVTLKGYYNGYNFRDEYKVSESGGINDAKFNSAIMVNGEDCTLDLTGLSHLFLAGRTFISRRGDGSNDIMMGESLSARTDQLACYVRREYLEIIDEMTDEHYGEVALYDEDGNPDQANGKYAKFTDKGLEKYNEATGVELASSTGGVYTSGYLDKNKQVVQYQYRDGGVSYYLNFKSEDAANQFFTDYWDSTIGGSKLGAYRDDYKLHINLDKSTLFTLGGTLRGEEYDSGTSTGKYLTRDGNDPTKWDSGSIYWQRAELLASTYESLKDSFIGENTVADLADEGDTDDVSPLFASLFNPDKLDELIRSGGYEKTEDTGKLEVKVTNDAVVISGTDFADEGIVIAKGDITVSKNFTGIVISDGKIKLNNGVEQSVDVVKRIFKECPQVAEIFKGYQPPSGSLRIGDYVTYENWTKNEE